jgi:signal transduction histidine kinase
MNSEAEKTLDVINEERKARTLAASFVFMINSIAWFFCLELIRNLEHVVYGSFGKLVDREVINRPLTVAFIWLIGLTTLLVIMIVIAARNTGSFDENGEIELTFFDRMVPEARICMGILVMYLLVFSEDLMTSWIARSGWLASVLRRMGDTFTDSQINKIVELATENIKTTIEPVWMLLFSGLVIALSVTAFETQVILSIVRSVKRHDLWKRSILGQIVSPIRRAVQQSDVTMLRAFLVGAAMLVLAFLGRGGLIAALLLEAFFVPRWFAQYRDIRYGIDQVRSGNFDYRIPVRKDNEFGRIAQSVNEIASAEKRALKEELSSQRMKNELISNVSHDIRTPLTSVITYVDLLKREGLDSENAQEYLDVIAERTARLNRLTEDLFDAAKASSGAMPVNIVRIDMNMIVEQAVAELGDSFKENDIELIRNPGPEPALVLGDGALLWRVLENLLTNANKYSMRGSRVYIDVKDSGKMISLEIKNVSEKPLNMTPDEMMERFKRGDGARNSEGSGLGLAIAKDLVNLMGGRFEIEIDGDMFKAIVSLYKADEEATPEE